MAWSALTVRKADNTSRMLSSASVDATSEQSRATINKLLQTRWWCTDKKKEWVVGGLIKKHQQLRYKRAIRKCKWVRVRVSEEARGKEKKLLIMTVCLTDILFVLATLFFRHQYKNTPLTSESVWLGLSWWRNWWLDCCHLNVSDDDVTHRW